MNKAQLRKKAQLSKLRKEIVLNSLSLKDYENSLGIDRERVYAFFDSFVEEICALYEEEHNTEKYWIQDVFDEYDNIDQLWKYYNCYVEDPLPIEDSIEDRYYDAYLLELEQSNTYATRV